MAAHFMDFGDVHFSFEDFTPRQISEFRTVIDRIAIDAQPLKISEVNDALIMPAYPYANGTFGGGAFDRDNQPVEAANIVRHDLGVVVGSKTIADNSEPCNTIDSAIYGGMIFSGYGHVILESLSRLWAADEYPTLPIIFIGTDAARNLKSFKIIVNTLGIDSNRILLIDQPTQVKILRVPQPGLQLGLYTNSNYISYLRGKIRAQFAGICADEPLRPELNCYFSRAGLKGRYRVGFGEQELEQWLNANGSVVVRPEKLPLSVQIALVNGYDRFSGLIGSQMHNLLFRMTSRPCTVSYLCSSNPNPNFFQIDLIIPGKRHYVKAANFDPMFEFGNRAPFSINLEKAKATLNKDLAVAHNSLPASHSKDAYLFAWFKNYFEFKVFRKYELAKPVDFERTEEWFLRTISDLLPRMARPLCELEYLDAIKAFDDTVCRHKMQDHPFIFRARQAISDLRK